MENNKNELIDSLLIRQGVIDDLQAVFDLVMELSIYEKAAHEVENSVERMKQDAFGDHPLFGFLVAESSSTIIGLSLYYFRYSTWKGKMLYLEDLIVSERFRKYGVGKKLFEATIGIAKNENCRGMIWEVLDWNEPAFKFYSKYEPIIDPHWVVCRLTKEQIDNYNPVS
jgi:GNAT superfamily N-acetyltransferase